jgi:hypothetical protein
MHGKLGGRAMSRMSAVVAPEDDWGWEEDHRVFALSPGDQSLHSRCISLAPRDRDFREGQKSACDLATYHPLVVLL